MHPVRARTVLTLALLAVSSAAFGQSPHSTPQYRCLTGMIEAGGELAQAISDDLAQCLAASDSSGSDASATIAGCLSDPGSVRTRRAQRRLFRIARLWCDAPPAFGYTGPATVAGA